jgi:hypothetical protein
MIGELQLPVWVMDAPPRRHPPQACRESETSLFKQGAMVSDVYCVK